MLSYREILKKSWETAWKNKFLWPFGLFIALFLGNESEYNNISVNGLYNFGSLAKIQEFFQKWGALPDENSLNKFSFTLFFGLAALIILSAIAMSTIFRGGLISCLDKIRKQEKTTFKEGVRAGMGYFRTLFGITMLSKAAGFILSAIALFPALFLSWKIPYFFQNGFLPFFILLIFLPLFVTISFITKYSCYYVVTKGEKSLNAIRKASRLWLKNWLITMEVSFILFIANFFVNVALAVIIFIVAAPFVLLGSVSFYSMFSAGFWITLATGLSLIAFIFLSVKSIFLVFQYNAWILLFSELTTEEKMTGKLRFFFRFLLNRLRKKSE